MTDRTYIASITLSLLIAPLAVSAQANANAPVGIKTVDQAVQEIRASQRLDADGKIDCAKVTAAQLEGLGDSVMEAALGSSERHELMDQMMGGEGSRSLSFMHQMMASRYLGCSSPYYGGMVGPAMMGQFGGMMGYGSGIGMMGNWFGNLGNANAPADQYSPWGRGGMIPPSPEATEGRGLVGDWPWGNMMGSVGRGLGWGFGFMLMFVLIPVVLGVLLIIALIRWLGSSGSGNARRILQERYAKGEITKEQYEQMKEHLA